MTPTPDVVALQAAMEYVIIREGSKLTEWYEPDAMETILRKGCPMNHDAEAADAAYIAAANPARITRVLAALRAAEQRAEAAEKDVVRMRDALDAIYNHNEAARAAVVQHYGMHHSKFAAALKQGEHP